MLFQYFNSSVGTRRFRSCINNYLNGYVAAKTKKEKSMVVTTIVDMFQKNKQPAGGGFIRKVSDE
jgi:hypothetical protein